MSEVAHFDETLPGYAGTSAKRDAAIAMRHAPQNLADCETCQHAISDATLPVAEAGGR